MKLLPVFIFFIALSSNAFSSLISYTGNFKIEKSECYREINSHPSNEKSWEKFDCIKQLEDSQFQAEILRYIELYHQLYSKKQLSNEAFNQIISLCINALYSKPEYRAATRKTLVEGIKSAQLKYPVKNTLNK